MKFWQGIRWFFLDKSSAAQRTRWLAKLVLLIVLFVTLFWVVDMRAVALSLANADPLYVALGIILSVPYVYLNAFQLRLLTRIEGISLSIWQIMVINLTIRFYLLFMPGTIVGSGMRWYKLSQPDGKSAEALAAVAFNRLFETFLVVVLGLGFWMLSEERKVQINEGGMMLLILGTVLLWFVFTRTSSSLSKWIAVRTVNIPRESLMWWGLDKTRKFLSAIAVYANFPAWDLLLLIGAGITRHLIGIVAFMAFALAVGIQMSFLDLGWIRSLISLFSMLPFSIAGGLGVREVSLVALLSAFGISAAQALSFSLLFFARDVIIGLVGGLLEFLQASRINSPIK